MLTNRDGTLEKKIGIRLPRLVAMIFSFLSDLVFVLEGEQRRFSPDQIRSISVYTKPLAVHRAFDVLL
jgi:hypothetical protein